MTTPLATIADAIIEFILSLLRDPEAAAKFADNPDKALSAAGLDDICAEDVRTVLPVVVDRPDVISIQTPSAIVHTTPPTVVVRPGPEQPKYELIREITNVANHFSIDNRATIVDQSVNQSIWAEGDVMQIFDQEAIIASGDESIAAGKDVLIDESTTDIETGDIAIGNTDTDVEINDSFNDSSTNVDIDVDADVNESFNDQSADADVDTTVEGSFNTESENVNQPVVVNESTPESGPASDPEPLGDLTIDDPVEVYGTPGDDYAFDDVEADPIDLLDDQP
ncbi:MAG TPA: IniB N-terminal domain-containing protein [Actinomycetaceae bacterium]|nr:IniB N-terminal domain-containing protein [Actinomycetaceae bacterium]